MRSLKILGTSVYRLLRTPGIPAALALFAATAASPALAQPFPADMCAADRTNGNLGCTSNDVAIGSVTVNNGVTSCVAGTSVTLDLNVSVLVNANQRYDLGVFVARDGKSPIVNSSDGGSTSCAVFGFPTSPPPLGNLDGNACGDSSSRGLSSIRIGTVTVPCTPDALGNLVIPAVVTWDNSSSATSCQAPPSQWVRASTKSNCSAGIAAQIPVAVTGSITIVKETTPAASPGDFAFNATGPGVSPAAFSLAAGQRRRLDTALLTTARQTYTVTEQIPSGFDLSSIACVDDLDNQAHPEFVSVDLATRTATISMSANGTVGLKAVTCTFGNTRHSSITVVKNAVGGNTTFPFTGPSPFSITTVGGTGQRVLPGLKPGTYTISEIVPAGWTLTSLVCADPTGDTTVLGGTATVTLGAAENVTCTYTDTALGAIRVSKQSIGGDGTFTFGGPQNFQITTTGGAGGPFTLSGLEPGIHAITEVVPADWQLSGIACTDPTGNTTTAAGTATIDLAAGELVECTFTNTRQASVTVEKQAIGGDGTFAFTGSRAFSITTTTGNGMDATTFASVPPGVALSIVETVPAGWTLTSAECRDAASDTPLGSPIANGTTITPGAGQAIICTFVDTKGATLRVFKHAVPQGPQVFPFTLTGPTTAAFSLVDDGSSANSTSFTNLPAGDYTVTEASVPGWTNTGITCSDIVEPDVLRRTTVDRSAVSATAHLRFGQTVECTFTNTQVQPGSITIHKKAVGGDGTFDFTGSGPGVLTPFAITTSGTDHTGSRVFTGLAEGTYTVAEQVPPGWDLAPQPIDCTVTGGSNTTVTQTGLNGVTIVLGTTGAVTDSVACEFVDIKRGSITITKRSSPQDPQLFTFTTASLVNTTSLPPSFQLADSGTPPNSRTFNALVPSIYTVTETVVPGWRLDDVGCTGGAVIASRPEDGVAVIDLQPGEDVVCTYTNARDGTITVTKVAQGGSPGDAFTFAGDLAGTIGNGQSITGRFADGTYAISEIVPAGWNITDIACTGGTVTYTGDGGSNPTPAFAPGDTTITVANTAADVVACTFTNVRQGSIRIVKNTLGGDGAFEFTGARDFQVATNGGVGENTTAFAAVPPGTYAVTESVPEGWRLSALACSDGSTVDLATATAQVTVAAGENVTCTFTDAREGSITITKRIRGPVSTAFGFTVSAALDPAGMFTLTPPPRSTASRVFTSVLPGRYTITESTLPPGWTLTNISCSGATASIDLPGRSAIIDLAIGNAAECIFDDSAFSTVTVSVLSVGGTGTFGFNGRRADIPGVLPFAVATIEDTVKAGSRFDSIAPGIVSVTGIGAEGFELEDVTCFGSPDTSWVVTGPLVVIAVADGDVIECIFYYDTTASLQPEPVALPVPALDLRTMLLLGLLLAVGAVAAWTRRSGSISRIPRP